MPVITTDESTLILQDPNVENIAITQESTSIVITDTSSSIVIQSDPGTIIVPSETFSTLLVGIAGPQGATGDDVIKYTKRVDFNTAQTQLYKGEANPGSAESGAVWRISFITIATADSDVVEIWADGNANFDNIWDDRLSLSYS